ncbi:hypothetical protein F5148DRAFT_1270040, partial [Russula earlei]
MWCWLVWIGSEAKGERARWTGVAAIVVALVARVEGLAPKPGCPRQPKRGGGEDGGLRSTQIQPHWGSQLKRAKPGRAEFVGLDSDPKPGCLDPRARGMRRKGEEKERRGEQDHSRAVVS